MGVELAMSDWIQDVLHAPLDDPERKQLPTLMGWLEAEAIAEVNNDGDEDGWTYRAEKYGPLYRVAVTDETGQLLGYL